MRNVRLIIFCFTVIIFSSCAVGRKVSYSNIPGAPDFIPSKKLAIACVDYRKEVLSGHFKPSYTGKSYSTVQIGYNINTTSGKPLSEEIGNSIKSALDSIGAKTISIITIGKDSTQFFYEFNLSSADRFLLFVINRWEASSRPGAIKINYSIDYDIALRVYDKNNILLAAAQRMSSSSDKQFEAFSSVKELQDIARETLRIEIKSMFNESSIRSSIE